MKKHTICKLLMFVSIHTTLNFAAANISENYIWHAFGQKPSLKKAIFLCDLELIESILYNSHERKNGFLHLVFAIDQYEKHGLITPCFQAHLIAELLNKYKVNKNEYFKNQTPLIKACKLCNLTALNLLIRVGANLNLYGSYKTTPLMITSTCNFSSDIEEKYLQLTNQLILSGADIDVQDNDGNTALILAAMYNKPMSVLLLLKAGANQNIMNNEHKNFMDYARQIPDILNATQKYKSELNLNILNNTPLHQDALGIVIEY